MLFSSVAATVISVLLAFVFLLRFLCSFGLGGFFRPGKIYSFDIGVGPGLLAGWIRWKIGRGLGRGSSTQTGKCENFSSFLNRICLVTAEESSPSSVRFGW